MFVYLFNLFLFGFLVHMGQFLRYVRENPGCIPTFVGIKFTSNDLDEGYEALKTGFSVFLGADTVRIIVFMQKHY